MSWGLDTTMSVRGALEESNNSSLTSLRLLLTEMQPGGGNDNLLDFNNYTDTYPTQPSDFASITSDAPGALMTSNELIVNGFCPHIIDGPNVTILSGISGTVFSINNGVYSATSRTGLYSSTYSGLRLVFRSYAPAVEYATYHYQLRLTEKAAGGRYRDISWYVTYNPEACFAYGTKINLANGDVKLIENLQVGDELLSCDIVGLPDESELYSNWVHWKSENINGVISSTIVTTIKHSSVNYYYLINDNIRVTYEHQFLIRRNNIWEWREARDLKAGDALYDKNQALLTINSVTKIDLPINVVLVNTENLDLFYAENILSHNKV